MKWIRFEGFFWTARSNHHFYFGHLTDRRILPKVFFQIYANQLQGSICLPAYLFYLLFR